jgi:M6 family metalloprotease-like protein
MLKKISLSLLLVVLGGCGSSSNTPSSEDSENNTNIVSSSPTPEQSNIPMLVVLLSYNNIHINSSQTLWSEKIFGKNPHQVNHYYMEASANHFEFSKAKESAGIVDDGVISLTLNKNHPDIDCDDPNFSTKVYPDLKLALDSIDSSIDFSNYDSNADGFISNKELLITFIMAGYEDSYEGRHVTNGIWAHQSCMYEESTIAHLDGVTVMSCQNSGNFAIFGERHDIDDPHDATIGIIAHELGHSSFGLPDLYNTVDPYSGGIGIFGLMGAGAWTTSTPFEKPGETPTHFSAWSKVFMGWITPQVLSNSSAILTESSSLDFNILKLPINDTSYYLLENRNDNGYDRGLNNLEGLFSGGVAIWKVDETKMTQENMLQNTVNADTYNKGVDLVEAKGSSIIDEQGGAGAEYSLYYDKNQDYFLNLVTNISARGSQMSLNIK